MQNDVHFYMMVDEEIRILNVTPPSRCRRGDNFKLKQGVGHKDRGLK